MTAQKQESRRNYIGFLSERIEQPRAAPSPARFDYRMKELFQGLMTVLLSRSSDVA
jgi:hypothetical protein